MGTHESAGRLTLFAIYLLQVRNSELENGLQGGTLVFQLTVSGEGGLESTDVINVEIYTEGTPPVAKSQSITTTSDTATSITLDASDKDGDALTYAIKTFPTHGSLSSLDKDSGSVTYTANSGYTGSDSFTFTASDGTSTSNAGKVSITVNSLVPINTLNTTIASYWEETITTFGDHRRIHALILIEYSTHIINNLDKISTLSLKNQHLYH